MTLSPLTPVGQVQAYRVEERTLWLECDQAHIALSVLEPGIVRVRLAPQGTLAPRRSWAVVPPDSDFAAVPFEVTDEAGGRIKLHTGPLTVWIERANAALSFADVAGNTFCADAGGLFSRLGDPAAGDRAGNPHIPTGESSPSVPSTPETRAMCRKQIDPAEHFFGLGQRSDKLAKQRRQFTNWTTDPADDHNLAMDAMYIAMPVLLSVQPGLAYGVLLNNTWRTRFRLGLDVDEAGQADTWRMEAEGGELDYYLLYGPTPAQVQAALGRLTGTLALPPRWALGHHQSRWGYDTAERVREIAASMRQHQIPCDVIHLDIDYMQGYRVFTWDAERFPDPAGLLADLRQQGIRTVCIIDPGVKVDPAYPVYQEGLEQDMFVRQADGELFRGYVWPDESVWPDFSRPDVRAWWGRWCQRLLDVGVAGIWNDMNEPAVFDRPFSENPETVGTIPTDATQGPADERTTHAELHNLYGLGMAQATSEALRQHPRNERSFVLNRSGFAGLQRYAAAWMGDNSAWWEHLEMMLPQLMNVGLSGMPFAGVDIGGFFGNSNGELLARWIQAAALAPFCRNHSVRGVIGQEPWAFGPAVTDIYRSAVQMRYRLLPYLYSLFYEASQTNAPIWRPLFYHFPNDVATYSLHDQVLVGPFLLCAPVYQPERTARAVYLPAGTWYDWWTNERLEGGGCVLAAAPLERMPLYVRAGAMLPTGPQMDYSDQHPLAPLTLELYPGEGRFVLYEDDGLTLAHEQGVSATTECVLARQADGLRLTIGERQGSYTPPERDIVLRLNGVGPTTAQGHPEAVYAAEQRTLTLHLPDDGAAHTVLYELGA